MEYDKYLSNLLRLFLKSLHKSHKKCIWLVCRTSVVRLQNGCGEDG